MICKNRDQKQRKRLAIWVNSWFQRRPKLDAYRSLMREVLLEEYYYKILG